jgi:dihydroorotase-like cyclic amidohydrolase
VRDKASRKEFEVDAELEEMGPIDYVLIEWPGRQPTGEAVPHLVDLVDKGIIRLLDLAFITKDEDGNVAGVEIGEVADQVEEMKVFEGASSGLLSDDDMAEAAQALEPGTSAALLVYENRWAGPFAAAVRRSGGQLVANGRIPVQALLAAIEAEEESGAANAAS